MSTLAHDAPAGNALAPGVVYIRNQPHLHYSAHTFFTREVQGKPLAHVVRETVSTSGWSLDMLGPFSAFLEKSDGREEDRQTWLLRHGPDLITLIEVVDGWADVATAGNDLAEVRATTAAIAAAIASKSPAGLIPITFWTTDPDKYPQPFMRKLEVPAWQDVANNYGTDVTAGMNRLFALQSCPKERLILWHGEPGTGKTHALRSLIHEWRDWCDVAFITDPERFVGGSPTYLFRVVNFTGGRTAAEARRRSKLIVLEDAGELMTPEARSLIGQGLSRLLNLTDGLLGQGMNIMVLITTNEPLSSMHPAVVRPGRCLCEMAFGALSADEANRWLRAQGSEVSVRKETSLAQLYAIAAGKARG